MTPPAASPSPSATPLKYRPDIDGLRAIAVLSVVGFHTFPNWVRGGFIGVDIFFVISGYLITTILLGDLAAGRFSYREFYARRIRRIGPALILVMAATLAFGWFVLLPDEFAQLGKHVAAGAAFVSNFAFWSESGYFDTAAESKPLLHLWSLAVEEQFYILWPPLLALAWRRGWRVLAVAATVAAVSFLINVAMLHDHPAATFYLPASRFWELMLGGLLAMRHASRSRQEAAAGHGIGADGAGTGPDRLAELQSLCGLALIAAGLLLLDSGRAFPGAWALFPAVGAFLCIGAGPSAWFNRRLLASRPMVWFGLISYPLYLWHWPLLAYARILEGGMPNRNVRAAAMLIGIGLAWLTWRCVEHHTRRNTRPALLYLLALAMTVLALAGAAAATGHLSGRHTDAQIGRVLAATRDWSFPEGFEALQRRGEPLYRVGNGRQRVLMLGDSHVEQYGARAVELARTEPERAHTIYFGTGGGCPPIPGVLEDRNPGCDARRATFIEMARSSEIDSVVVGGCWNCYFIDQARPDPDGSARDAFYFLADGTRHGYRTGDGVERSLAGLEALLKDLAARKPTYLLLDNPIGPDFGPESLISGERLGRMSVRRVSPTAPQPVEQLRLRERLLAIAERSGAIPIDPQPAMCRDGECMRTTADGDPVFKDFGHLRSEFTRKFATYLDVALAGGR
ncbi:MAG: acyltransferase [Comamonadaceae bacterium]|nr:MAG: acyltransferase [Comamonadaceae bacterium]